MNFVKKLVLHIIQSLESKKKKKKKKKLTNIAFGFFWKILCYKYVILYVCFTRSSPFPSLNPRGVFASLISAPLLYLKEKKTWGWK